jgi:hypothetical protein
LRNLKYFPSVKLDENSNVTRHHISSTSIHNRNLGKFLSANSGHKSS